jgi:hypothetical protein
MVGYGRHLSKSILPHFAPPPFLSIFFFSLISSAMNVQITRLPARRAGLGCPAQLQPRPCAVVPSAPRATPPKKDGSATPMDKEAAARIQAAEAKKGDGGVDKDSFAARAQSAAAKNEAGDEDDAGGEAKGTSAGKGGGKK